MVRLAQASKDENGHYTNGKAGDQTGSELNICAWYNRPWDTVLRPISVDLGKQFGLCIQGRMSFKDVENAFKSWIMSFKKILSKRTLHNLYNLYNEQFKHAFTLYGGTYGREAYNCT